MHKRVEWFGVLLKAANYGMVWEAVVRQSFRASKHPADSGKAHSECRPSNYLGISLRIESLELAPLQKIAEEKDPLLIVNVICNASMVSERCKAPPEVHILAC
eukprot:121815-Pelagomonas_calceolata.AAC.6